MGTFTVCNWEAKWRALLPLELNDVDGVKSITQAIGRGGPWKSQLFWAQMTLSSLVAILGPKKNQFHYVPRHINHRYIKYINNYCLLSRDCTFYMAKPPIATLCLLLSGPPSPPPPSPNQGVEKLERTCQNYLVYLFALSVHSPWLPCSQIINEVHFRLRLNMYIIDGTKHVKERAVSIKENMCART
jgi:hypothetical protein